KVVTSGNIISKCTSTIDNMNSKIVLHNSISDSLEKKLYYYDIEINLWQPKALRDSLEGLGFDVAVFKAFDNRKDASENDYKIVFVGRKNK
ncbi:MAG: hypothetical protein Q8P81_01550, partial [Nanoarchaeota archaeon]|nr:hypothetical protein [Nanoarchaeota archaeon]